MLRRHLVWMSLTVCCLASFAIVFVANLAGKLLPNLLPTSMVTYYAMLIGWVFLSVLVFSYLIIYRAYKGFIYFLRYRQTILKLEKQLLDAGYGIVRGNITELPKIKLSFDKGFKTGLLSIRNSIKLDKKLSDALLSGALSKMKVESHYLSDDGNWHHYFLLDWSTSFRKEFCSYKQFLDYNKTIPPYSLFFDSRTDNVALQHMLLVGQTGTGKSYSLFGLILQMLNKPIPYHLYFADPKGSSIAVLGDAINPDCTAVDFERIIVLLEDFVIKMRERKIEMRNKLKVRVDADFTYFGFDPYVFIFDEYAAFSAILSAENKQIRDKVRALIYEIILQGRQLGFFLVLSMQKSDATLIDTALRDNLPIKVVLGASEPQTYITAFGHGVDIPARHYKVGEGVYIAPNLASTPRLVQFPSFNFDLLHGCMASPRDVITGAPEDKTITVLSSKDEVKKQEQGDE